MLAEQLILYGVLAFMWLHYLWELYLCVRQHRVCTTVVQVPRELRDVFPADVCEKARLYAVDRIRFLMFKNLYLNLIGTLLIWFQGLLYFWNAGTTVNMFGFYESEILQSVVFVLVTYTVYTLVKIPLDIYSTFVLEEKYRFNQQTLQFFAKDNLIHFLLLQLILIPVSVVVVCIIKAGGNYLSVYLWLFLMIAIFFGLTVYPDYIAPLFDKYTPLPDSDLKTRIEQLAAIIGFPLYKIYVVEGSKRSKHSNAYLYGFYKNKRIVLFDTLLKDYTSTTGSSVENKGCDDDEVLGVLAHELGHWKLNHVLKNIALLKANLLLMFLMYGQLFRYKALYVAFGFRNEEPVLIGLLIVTSFVLLPYNSLITFCTNCLSRRFEFQADAFAKSLGMGAHLRSALTKLEKNNLCFPVHDRLYSMWHYSHPPLLERLTALDKTD